MNRRPHPPTCRHCPRVRQLGVEFQAWRASWDVALEDRACGYATEAAEFRRAVPPPTFKRYLIAMTGAGWPMSGSSVSRRRLAA